MLPETHKSCNNQKTSTHGVSGVDWAHLLKQTLLLLDEATSNLDSENKRRIQDVIDALLGRGDITIVIITHRLSIIRKTDVIYVLDNGRIVECGD